METIKEILKNYEISLSEDYEGDIRLDKVILDILKVLAEKEDNFEEYMKYEELKEGDISSWINYGKRKGYYGFLVKKIKKV